jgi:hypothetical protein
MNEEPDQAALEHRASADPGENMNVRHVHAAIWREESEPAEVVRRMPAILKHFYFWMLVWLILYLMGWFPPLSWNEYEANRVERGIRDRARETAPATNPQP